MKRSRVFAASLFAAIACLVVTANTAAAKQQPSPTPLPSSPPQLSRQDEVLLAETYHLWQSLGEKVWAGWTQSSMPFIYVTEDYEYAVGFPKALQGYAPLGKDALLDKTIQARKRVFGTHASASFPYEGVPAVVIGTPAALGKSPSAWVLTASHEMFHVLQDSRGGIQKVRQLKIGSDSDPGWQLNFPFPYKDADVMRLIHLQGYPLYLAATDAEQDAVKYDAGTAADAVRVYRSFLRQQSPDNKLYDYSRFQEWQEGIAFYTEYRMAELAASGDYRPAEAFLHLPGYESYGQVWDEDYKRRTFLVKHAGRAAQSRTAFYHLGLGKGLLLDKLVPDWKSRYFAPGVWLDDLIFAALGQPEETPALTVGVAAPDFSLTDVSGAPVSLSQYRGKVVLLDFWQTWCVPCVEAIPHLKSLQEKYRAQGLVILGVTDRLDAEGLATLRKFAGEYKINYPLLVDDKGKTAALYSILGYPHAYIIGRDGRVALDRHGAISEAELEREINAALRRAGD
ncbi:MAG: TlpA family protein disulfide reductase [Acidobacteriota bacterium]|nr:TlpA family protein disulfide reductase [Acidobacteriota bacterium]